MPKPRTRSYRAKANVAVDGHFFVYDEVKEVEESDEAKAMVEAGLLELAHAEVSEGG